MKPMLVARLNSPPGRAFLSGLRRTAVAITIASVAACSEFQVKTDYDHGADFSRLHTYAWTEPENRTPIDPRVDTKFINENVRRVVDEELLRKGFEKVDEARADFLVAYAASVRRKVNAVDLGGQQGYGAGLGPADDAGDVGSGGSGTLVEEYEEGKLTISVLPKYGGRSMWRSSVKAAIFLDDPADERAKRLRRAVKRAISGFPP